MSAQRQFNDELDLPPNKPVTFTALKAPQPFVTSKGNTRWRYSVETEHGRLTLWASEDLHTQLSACDSATATVTKRFEGRTVYFEVHEGGNQPSTNREREIAAAVLNKAPNQARQAQPATQPRQRPTEDSQLIAHQAVDMLMQAASHAHSEYNVPITFEGKDVQAMIATLLRDGRERR